MFFSLTVYTKEWRPYAFGEPRADRLPFLFDVPAGGFVYPRRLRRGDMGVGLVTAAYYMLYCTSWNGRFLESSVLLLVVRPIRVGYTLVI